MNNIKSDTPHLMIAGVKSVKKDENGVDIELRSGEVQELMNRPPNAILKSGITIIFIFVISFFILSFYIEYPEQSDVNVKLFPSDEIDCIYSPCNGRILWVNEKMITNIGTGDTLMKLINNAFDTLCVISSIDGLVYKTDALEKNIEIIKGQRLFYVESEKDKCSSRLIHGVFYVPHDSIPKIRSVQTINIPFNGRMYSFNITEFGHIANSDGRYPVIVSYIDSMRTFNVIEPQQVVAKIYISKQTVFERFFAKKINIFEKIKS